jgi:protein-tyrosine-phosphatase
MKILFICLSNIQRSQFAEAFFNKLSKKDRAISAGLHVSNNIEGKEIGQISEKTVQCMKEIGYDISHKKSKQLTEQMVNESDKVIVFEKNNLPNYLKNSNKVILWKIDDPGGKDMDIRRNTRDKIKSLVEDLFRDI